MTEPPGPELRRSITAALLRSALRREPRLVEIAQALHGSGNITDAAALTHHVARWLGQVITRLEVELRDARASHAATERELSAVQAELTSILSSTSWYVTEPLRAAVDWMAAARRKLRGDAPNGPWRPFGLGRRAATAIVSAPSLVLTDPVPVTNAAPWCVTDHPQISIIVTHCGDEQVTADCVKWIWASTAGISYELIIVDTREARHADASFRNLSPPARIIRTGTARFSGEASNIGAEAAQAPYICLLNNSARVREGWLTKLYAAIRADPAYSAVGPKLLGSDGGNSSLTNSRLAWPGAI